MNRMYRFLIKMMLSRLLLLLLELIIPSLYPAKVALADESGYFLSLRQKGQLIWLGDIYDQKENSYDILICPGYVPPTRLGREALKHSRNEMASYIHAGKYLHARDNFQDVFEWTYKDCFREFTYDGTKNAWVEYFGNANRFAEKRVFGWWIAHPWALFKSVVHTSISVPIGLTGTAGGTIVGIVGVPAFHTLNSATNAAFILAGGIVLTGSGYAWNTVISPPLALLGQKPDESRVDGFWVRRTTKLEREAKSDDDLRFTDEELASIFAWGKILKERIEPFDYEREIIEKENKEAIELLNKDAEEEKQSTIREEKEVYQELITSPAYRSILEKLDGRYSQSRLNRTGNQVHGYFTSQGFSISQREKLLELIRKYPPVLSDSSKQRDKSNPVQESIDVIKEIK